MDNLTFPKIKEALEKFQNIGIAIPTNSGVDTTASALSLYLSLKTIGKNVQIASPTSPLVEVSSLVGVDEIQNSFGGAEGDLIVSFPYKEGEIDKVSYTRDDNYLNIVVKAGELGLNFDEKEVKFSRGGEAPQLLFVIGASRISDLGNLFNPDTLKDTMVVNIDNSAKNQGFGDVLMVSSRLSSISEAIANLLLALNLKIDLDVAQNLITGIASATQNFQSENTSPLAFEIAGILMRQGATRPSARMAAQRSIVSEDDFIKQQERQIRETQPRTTIQQGSRTRTPEEIIQDLRAQRAKQAQGSQPGTETRASEPVLENVEKKDLPLPENPPDDWLEPKIYKGSTNF